ncbi:hypothetical protein DF152_08395 [Burkholderia cenocepacia]|nr:hypothetical protein DF152_08395 [Burkholderia cenocepacia]
MPATLLRGGRQAMKTNGAVPAGIAPFACRSMTCVPPHRFVTSIIRSAAVYWRPFAPLHSTCTAC